MKFKDISWLEFNVKDLFIIERGQRLVKKNRKSGEIPLITAGFNNNGVAGFISNIENKTFSHAITIDMFANVFYRDYQFKCDDNIHVLTSNKLSKYAGIYVLNSIKKAIQGIFSYGKQLRLKSLLQLKILLPTLDNENPCYEYMEFCIKKKYKEKLINYKNFLDSKLLEAPKQKIKPLKEVEWQEYSLNKLFDEIQRGKRLKKADHIKGETAYVSSTSNNNGVDGFIGNDNKVRLFSKCLTVANSGSVGSCFYQPYNFIASDHVTKLENKLMDKYIYQFIGTVVLRLAEKYSFNREINDKRIKREKILLPVDSQGKPAYQYMGSYMQNIEHQRLKKIKSYLDRKITEHAN
ncbi:MULTISPECIES: restriction endonuclease subunit S [Cysteiniphilum]|uniref:restriction endonuclease subunit S n=1 Tax=Cysteiniphilum TaxID=2056696 RepID=UPI001786492E|nr:MULTISPECIES: restriction endonuclease subunit S [Cysteiniphilum]